MVNGFIGTRPNRQYCWLKPLRLFLGIGSLILSGLQGFGGNRQSGHNTGDDSNDEDGKQFSFSQPTLKRIAWHEPYNSVFLTAPHQRFDRRKRRVSPAAHQKIAKLLQHRQYKGVTGIATVKQTNTNDG